MSNDKASPVCPECHHPLDRIDHHAIEHLILRDDVYCPVGIDDGDGKGGYGLASEVDLRCGYCGEPLPRETREHFYRRHYQVVEFNRRVAAETGDDA